MVPGLKYIKQWAHAAKPVAWSGENAAEFTSENHECDVAHVAESGAHQNAPRRKSESPCLAVLLAWSHQILADLIWFDMIWYDLIWFDMIWYDLIWFDMIWCSDSRSFKRVAAGKQTHKPWDGPWVILALGNSQLLGPTQYDRVLLQITSKAEIGLSQKKKRFSHKWVCLKIVYPIVPNG